MSDPSQSPSEGRRSESVLGPFTTRDLTLFGGVLITFVASLLPLFGVGNLWNAAGLYFLGIGILVPVAAAALFAWRRLEPSRRLRVGSLSVDQFASVAAVLSAAFYFLGTVTTLSPGAVVGLLGGLAMLAATTIARLIPVFAVDFLGRPEVPAHVMARDAVPPAPRPAGAAKPQRGRAGAAAGSGAAGNEWGSPATGEWTGPAAAQAPGRPGEAAAVPGAGPSTGGPVAPFAGTTPAPTVEAAAGTEPNAPAPDDDGAPERAVGVFGAADGEAYGAPAASEAPVEPAAAEPAEREATAEETAAEPGVAARAGASAGADAAAEPGVPAEAAAPVGHTGSAEPAAAARPAAPTVPAPSAEPDGPVAPTEVVEAAGAGPATAVFPAAGRGPTDSGVAGQGSAAAEDIGATRPYEDEGTRYEAFWFAVSQPRTAVDATTGQPVFTLEPGQWILALQDRGQEFVVQSPDGRVGVLRDLSGIERA
ncbi:hypothetical protein [Sinomonas atrocyanea]|uniref:hypothetical protein n=1 Tax=Sinomonas atrocyanea TaxID=37927 RepID=UPI0027895D9D|nr:hypothetical protein [Sinomonas atrocyanea]MDQ0259043.1 hypothetical protein [Sinomonas atrocyanea]MDR6621850.1 hypothetical protein [Sinomonas atrocyanea]